MFYREIKEYAARRGVRISPMRVYHLARPTGSSTAMTCWWARREA